MASSVGGAAAINGFLYQILHQLSLIATTDGNFHITVDRKTESAILILEPIDGGDSSYKTDSFYLVEQYKARTTDTPWSLNEIIKKVLPDLRLAASSSYRSDLKCEFHFITDGRISDIKPLTNLITILKEIDFSNFPERIEEILDSENLTLLNEIKSHTRRRETSREKNTKDLIIVHLLKNFHIKQKVTQEHIISNITTYIKKFQHNVGDEYYLTNQLIGYLMRETSKGCFKITARKLLAENNMNPDRIIKLNQLATESSKISLDRLKKFFDYKSEFNVRVNKPSFNNKNILIITGESGYGKTWLFCNTIVDLLKDAEIVIFEKDLAGCPLNKIANTIWKTILGETTQKEIEDVALFYKELSGNYQKNWLTVALDDVRDLDLLNSLLSRDWGKLGIRLLMTVPQSIATTLSASFITIYNTNKFSVDELSLYLSKFHKSWIDLPFDLRDILRIPILAKLYVSLPHDTFSESPSTEYEIFDQLWQKKLVKPSTANYASDEARLKKLAGKFTQDTIYPYSYDTWSGCGLTDDILSRLEKLGWLRVLPNSEVEFTHDRILNWVVAKDIAYRFSRKQLTQNELIELIAPNTYHPFLSPNKQRLGYILLDTIWVLLCDDYPIAKIVELIVTIEKNHAYFGVGEHLYDQLLPTLGSRGVYLIEAIIKSIKESDSNKEYKAKLLGKGLSKITSQNINDIVYRLLYSSVASDQIAAIEVLKCKSYPELNSRLWYLYQEYLNTEDCQSFNQTSSIYKALKTATQYDPNWLKETILGNNTPYTYKLAFFLSEVNRIDLWHDCKNHLIKITNLQNARSIIYCIRNYYDSSLLSYLVTCLSINEDGVSTSAFEALTHLNHSLAIDNMGKISKSELYLSRYQWLPILICKNKERLANYLSGNFLTHELILLLEEHTNLINTEISKLILDDLDHSINYYLSTPDQNILFYIERQLKILTKIKNPEINHYIKEYSLDKIDLILFEIIKNLEQQNRFLDPRSYEFIFLNETINFLIKYSFHTFKEVIVFGLTQNDSYRTEKYLDYAILTLNDNKIVSLVKNMPNRIQTFDKNQKQTIYYKLFTLLSILDDKYLIAKNIASSNACYSLDNFDLLDNTTSIPTDKILEIFQDINKDDQNHLLYIFSISAISNNKEITSYLYPHLDTISHDDLLIRSACVALFYLNDKNEHVLNFAEKALHLSSQKDWATNILLNIGDKSLETLNNYIKNNFDQKRFYWSHTEYRILNFLFKTEEYREKAIEYALKICTERYAYEANFIYIASFSKDQHIKDLVIQKAFYEHSSIPSEVFNAIKALFIYSPNQALQALKKLY